MGLKEITSTEEIKNLKGKTIYSAVFLTEEIQKALLRVCYKETGIPPLTNIKAHHVTLEFKPANIGRLPIGQEVELKIIGLAFDDDCHAVVVELPEELFCSNKHPHITVSHSDNVTPKYSNELLEGGFIPVISITDADFKAITLKGVVGVYGKV